MTLGMALMLTARQFQIGATILLVAYIVLWIFRLIAGGDIVDSIPMRLVTAFWVFYAVHIVVGPVGAMLHNRNS